MKGVQCYELFGGIAFKNHAFYTTFCSSNIHFRIATEVVITTQKALKPCSKIQQCSINNESYIIIKNRALSDNSQPSIIIVTRKLL